MAVRDPVRILGRRAGHPGFVTDPEDPRPDDESDEAPAFDIDLEPEDQGSAEAAEEATG